MTRPCHPDRGVDPPRGRVRWRRPVAVLLCVAVVGTACTSDRDDPTPTGSVDRAAIESVAGTLPADPVEAAERLVGVIHAEDPGRSAAATAELLRRSGHPIVSAKGPVVALPDQVTLYDAPVYAELIPLLATATRAQDRYTVDQLGSLLQAVGLTPKKLTFAQLTTAVAGWAKEPDDHPIFVSAAAGVRALSAHRDQVLFSGADPTTTHLDPLQTILLLGHATSRLAEVLPEERAQAAARPGLVDRLLGGGVAYAGSDDGPCQAITRRTKPPQDPVAKGIIDSSKGYLKDGLVKLFPKETQDRIGRADEVWGKSSAAASAILLLLGARLSLTADKTSTHFKHTAGSRAEHITMTAKASFDLEADKDLLECYSLAGVTIPPAGPLKDFTIRWNSVQPQAHTIQKGGMQLLRAVSADSRKATRGVKTGSDGTATLEVKPPVEDPDGEGEKLTGYATYLASLDRESLPFELGDAYGLLSNPVGFGVGKNFDLLRDVLVKVGLPEQSITLEVTYHGVDIVLAQGENEVDLILAKLPRVYVDLVSCAGVGGPFKGTAGYDGARSGQLLQMAGAAAGVRVPKDFSGKKNQISVLPLPDHPGPHPFFIMKGEGGSQFLDGVLRFYPFLNTRAVVLADYRIGRPVGDVEILLAGDTYPFSKLSWPVVRVTADPRCPKVRYFHDET
ncbi:hypothetical protein E0H26_08795 [Micromonospora zingiberis]|uniref:Uncharacterized protein n=1 Tax=Micromonospora zingiberis TaxID=2053011 RepID=A0A4R0GM56_9ACTN|nr:hypothetical protein [Micromonospora zingiberis]TCB98466.1 hypothetical protein E0H26_08795 [Micromonospora zingiberis]